MFTLRIDFIHGPNSAGKPANTLEIPVLLRFRRQWQSGVLSCSTSRTTARSSFSTLAAEAGLVAVSRLIRDAVYGLLGVGIREFSKHHTFSLILPFLQMF